ncbi:sugar phosphate isomerase/epimerase family protein [Nocardia sp. NPDC059239]|uniref:sugar phosphate isomerase/epimerase family protein n=1 Tax=Nocardia sp. NPDC059239 TaxID=3346785 RepID=UPI0036CFC51E
MTGQPHTQLYVHTYAYRYRLRHDPDFTFFDVIADARQRGFDGINASVYGPAYTEISGHTTSHFADIRAALSEAGLGIDIETNGTEPEHLHDLLSIGAQLGAENLRTYTTGPLDRTARVQKAIANLAAAAPLAAEHGIRLLLENHEELDCTEVATVVEAVNSPWVRALFDYGNDMMLNRHPLDTLDELLPWITTAHLKDQIVYTQNRTATRQTLGVPIGQGRLPIREITQRLIDAGVPRICFENTWAYVAPIAGFGDDADHTDGVFAPQQLSDDDPRHCTDAEALERTHHHQHLLDTEPRMLDESCTGLQTILAGLPITLPTTSS